MGASTRAAAGGAGWRGRDVRCERQARLDGMSRGRGSRGGRCSKSEGLGVGFGVQGQSGTCWAHGAVSSQAGMS